MNTHRRLGAVALAATALLSTAAFAAESSCPSPCATPPKWALFARDNGGTDQWGIEYLTGTLLKGTRKTVLRIDASVIMKSAANVSGVSVVPHVNGYLASQLGASQMFPCTSPSPDYCTTAGTFWFDIDAMEAAHPGEFIDRPLNIEMHGRTVPFGVTGLQYEASFSAQIVKKK